jgi:hypothetical protein
LLFFNGVVGLIAGIYFTHIQSPAQTLDLQKLTNDNMEPPSSSAKVHNAWLIRGPAFFRPSLFLLIFQLRAFTSELPIHLRRSNSADQRGSDLTRLRGGGGKYRGNRKKRRKLKKHRHIVRGGHGLPKVSSGPAMPYPSPSTPCRPPLKWPYGGKRGDQPAGWVACSHLLRLWTPHALRLCKEGTERGKDTAPSL